MSPTHPAADAPVLLGGRRAARDTQEPIFGGVAAGLARHLAVPVLWVRVGLVAGAMPGARRHPLRRAVVDAAGRHHSETAAPGIESATHGGRRPVGSAGRRPARTWRWLRLGSAPTCCCRRCSAAAPPSGRSPSASWA